MAEELPWVTGGLCCEWGGPARRAYACAGLFLSRLVLTRDHAPLCIDCALALCIDRAARCDHCGISVAVMTDCATNSLDWQNVLAH